MKARHLVLWIVTCVIMPSRPESAAQPIIPALPYASSDAVERWKTQKPVARDDKTVSVGVKLLDQTHAVKPRKPVHRNHVIMRQDNTHNETVVATAHEKFLEVSQAKLCAHAYSEMCTALNACENVDVCTACMGVQFEPIGSPARKKAEIALNHGGGRVMAFDITPATKAGCTLIMAVTWCMKREWHAERKAGIEGPERPQVSKPDTSLGKHFPVPLAARFFPLRHTISCHTYPSCHRICPLPALFLLLLSKALCDQANKESLVYLTCPHDNLLQTQRVCTKA
jgi:hypothetical protein